MKLSVRLRRAIDELYFAAAEVELDRQSRGPRIKKNRATLANQMRFIEAAAEMIELLRRMRAVAAHDPNAAAALRKNEARIIKFIDRFDTSFPGDPHDHTVH